MRLHRIGLYNFRQFRGRQEINFGGLDGNVVVVYGENGRGKTGLFRALVFGLYGDKVLPQDEGVSSDQIYLVNIHAMREAIGKPVQAGVELEFSHADKAYSINRMLSGIITQKDGRVFEQVTDVSMCVRDASGNTRSVDVQNIDAVVKDILDGRVKEYFLFDGEKIERLTRASKEQREEVQRGVRGLLHIDTLEEAMNALHRVERSLRDDHAQISPSIALNRLMVQLGEIEKQLDEEEEKVAGLENEEHLIGKELETLTARLAQFDEIRQHTEERSRLLGEREQLTQDMGRTMGDMKRLLGPAAILAIGSTIAKVYEDIDSRKQKGELPPQIRRDLIERILADGECICGRRLRPGEPAFEAVEVWRDRVVAGPIEDSTLDLWRHLSELRNRHVQDYDDITKYLLSYANLEQSARLVEGRIEDVTTVIGKVDRSDISSLEEERKRREGDLVDRRAWRQNAARKVSDLKKHIERLKAQIREEQSKNRVNEELATQCELAAETRNALVEIYDGFTREVRSMIGRSATAVLKNCLDEQGKLSLRKVVVNDDYSLEVLDRWGAPVLANISAGQRQLMSISFISALAIAAGYDERIEMPLFMDTPFGRLSHEHRVNLIHTMPKLASQWVILATDTEFRKPEARALKDSGRWARFFYLKGCADGSTEIEEKNVEHAVLPMLQEGDLVL